MATTEELRMAMNDLAAGTESLSSAALLRAGKRHRTRRRLLVAAGAAAAVLAVVGVASLVAGRPGGGQSAPVAAAESPVAPASPSVPGPSRADRFAFGPEKETEPGVFTTVITDRRLPDGATDQAQLDLMRIPGETELGPAGADADTRIRTLTVAGAEVRLEEEQADVGWNRQLEWIAGGTRYVLAANAYSTDAGTPYGATEDDLRWLVERTIKR
ncbi:hypothetical protein GCM10020358_24040 [Amorphoplanes nipponensis]|uniref:Uncharacterized protein n=1 Tax=Actinoplanes nipponensis TaxID=135950 RepID=A0A919JHX6_9ACTN|nr:hypothetical protein [Actinoplanes nipponensis]GIE51058.1 hypothetical protein Ani05nite_45920 [Actinoplanes nipponensis]